MCGIAGAAAKSGCHVPSLDVIRRMCDAIYHRGPDDEGIHYSREVALGMRRLAIIDPVGGAQPIRNETGKIQAVVNGEIYNYRELRRRLEGMGHVFITGSDVECVVHAYEEYGTGCFAELRGMFAIAIWDGNSRSLVLARDRFGKKPLFYAETGNGICFGSELKSLLQVPGIDADINRQVVADYMTLGYVPTPDSIVSGVRKLEAAHFLVFHEGEVTTGKYWSLRYTPKLEFSEDRLADMLDKRLDEAVAIRLNSDVPFGAFLSGGVDSSLVVAMMTRHLDHPVKTFSIGFEDAAFDESEDARTVARHLGTEHHDLVVNSDAVELLENIAWYLDEPMADSSVIPTYLVSRLAAGHVKMVLTGDGGDEMFGGYTRYVRYLQLKMMKRAGLRRVAPLLRRAARYMPAAAHARVLRVCNRLGMDNAAMYLDEMMIGRPGAIRSLLGKGVPTRSRPAADGQPLGALDTVIHDDVHAYLLDDILVKVDRASMANSLEARSPLLDHELAEFAARLPERFKVRGTTTKYLLKRVASRYLPENCVHKRKQGFAIPLARWLRTDLAELLMDTVSSRAFSDRDVFDRAAARRLAEEHIKGIDDHASALWALLVFEMWVQRYQAGDLPKTAGMRPEFRPAAI